MLHYLVFIEYICCCEATFAAPKNAFVQQLRKSVTGDTKHTQGVARRSCCVGNFHYSAGKAPLWSHHHLHLNNVYVQLHSKADYNYLP